MSVKDNGPLQFQVRVPATSANLGPGFDCMGIALSLFNDMTVTVDTPFSVEITGESALLLPTDRSNVVVQTIDSVLRSAHSTKVPENWSLRLDNAIPVAGGLGSSASAIIGGLLLGNAMLEYFDPDRRWGRQALLDEAVRLEGHPDNVTPALFGGAWLSVGEHEPSRSFPIPVPENLVFVAASPNFPLRTEDARRVLPAEVLLRDAVWNTAQSARLTLALATGQLELLRGGFGDRLHEPYRKKLIPGYDAVRQAAIRQGAVTITLSGAGPTMLAWCDGESAAAAVADEMTLAWRAINIECYAYILRPYTDEPLVRIRSQQGTVEVNRP